MKSLMKSPSFQSLACGLALAVSGSASADGRAKPVNFRALNPIFQAMVDTTIAADDTVDFAYPRFDEKACDLSGGHERLKYDIQGSMKTTPWLDGERADVSGWSTFVTDRSFGHTGIEVVAHASVRTDTLALVRYSAYLAQKKTRLAEDPEFGPRTEAILKRLAVAVSFEQVNELLEAARQLGKDSLNHQIDKQRERLRCLEARTCLFPGQDVESDIKYTKSGLASLQRWQPYYDQVRVEKRIEGGAMRGLSLLLPDANDFCECRAQGEPREPVTYVGRIKLDLSARAATAETAIFHQMPQADLERFTQEFHAELVGNEQGDAIPRQSTQERFREALIYFKRVIRGQF